MKRILFVIDTLQVGGAEVSLLEILSRFTRYEPVMCHIYPGAELAPRYGAAGVKVIGLNLPGHYNFSAGARALEKVIQDYSPAIVHSTLFRADIITRLCRKPKGVPLVSSFVNNSYHRDRYAKMGMVGKLKLRGVQLMDAISARRVDFFVSNSEEIKERSASDLWLNRKKIQVIYRGRRIENFQGISVKQVAKLKESLGVKDRRIVLNVSRLLDRKGQLDLVRAFAQVKKMVPDVHLLIAGEGSFRMVLEKEMDQLNIRGSISLLGNRSDVPELLGIADMFVFPSYYEGLPGALVEAMMAKVPIVASNIPENFECVGSDGALLFKRGDLDELVRQMNLCLNDSNGNQRRIETSFQASVSKFEISNVVAQYERMYDELLRQ
jgi:glycosyltransferase involved in cell wall biosynthesis